MKRLRLFKSGKKKIGVLVAILALAGTSGVPALAYTSDGYFNFTIASRGSTPTQTTESVTKTRSGDAYAYISNSTRLDSSHPIYLRVRKASNNAIATNSVYVTSEGTARMTALSGYSTGVNYHLWGESSNATTTSVKVSGSWRP